MNNNQKNLTSLLTVVSVLLIIFIGYGWYRYSALGKEFEAAKAEISTKSTTIAGLEKNISEIEFEKTSLNDALEAEKSKNDDFEEQIEDLAGTVGVLDKLSKIDPELLKKYSKVFFLSEHYVPARLANIDEKYLSNAGDTEQVNSKVLPFLKKLLDRSVKDEVGLRILSGYRSFATQGSLKSSYKVIYGAGTANQFSAEQGYSEHQLGTTVDFTNPTIGSSLTNFDKSPEFAWLKKNAHRYGFVLSYPPGNTYYQYEPWHWRFVGEELANKLHDDDQYFYDLDQRDIDKYLISIFD